MSPQLVEEEKYSLKADIWSLGIVFYELLTGSRPFRAASFEQLSDCI